MAAPDLDAKSIAVSAASDGKRHSKPTTWANVSPFNVGITGTDGSPQYRIKVPTGTWGAWTDAGDPTSITGTRVGSVSFAGLSGITASTVTESAAVQISTQGHEMQIRMTASGTAGASFTTVWTIGSLLSGSWTVTTVEAAGSAMWSPTDVTGRPEIVIPLNTVSTNYFGTGVAPGTVITLRGGVREPVHFYDYVGTAENPIVIRNEPNAARVQIKRAVGQVGNFLFQLRGCQHVIVDGLYPYTGATGDYAYGIFMTADASGDRPGAFKLGATASVVCTNIRVRGMEVNGGWDLVSGAYNGSSWAITGSNTAVGIAFHCSMGVERTGVFAGAVCEDMQVEFCKVRNVTGEAVYWGQNEADNNNNPIPLSGDCYVRYNDFADTGRDTINTKLQVGGSLSIYNNTLARSGLRNTMLGGEEFQKYIMGSGIFSNDVYIYNNKIYDAGLEGIYLNPSTRVLNTWSGTFTVSVYNNVVARTGVVAAALGSSVTKGRGVALVGTTDNRVINASVQNNTLVGCPHHTIYCDGSFDSLSVYGNIWNTAGTFPGATKTSGTLNQDNNLGDTVANLDFVDDTTDDYRLLSTSAGVGAGTGAGSPPDEDILGVSRPATGYNLGAYEGVF